MKKNVILSGVVILFLVILCYFGALNSKLFAKDFPEYKKLVQEALQSENWSELNKYSDDIIKYHPKSAFGYFFKGIAMDELGEYELAIVNYSKSIEYEPNNADIFQNRGLAYYHNKDYDNAIADYKKALELDPNNKLAEAQMQDVINAKNGFVIVKNGNVTNYQSINDPFYLVEEYKQMPEKKKKEMVNSVKNYSADVLPIYYIAVAEDIYPTDKNLASFLYALGRYRSMQDVMVCADKSAYQAARMLPLVAPKTAAYISKMNSNDLANLLQKVLDFDSKNPNRPDPKWICYHGIEVFSNKGKVSTISKDEWNKNKNKMRESTSKYIEQLRSKDK